MSEPDRSSLDSVLAEILTLEERGEPPIPHEFLERYPEHADELKDFFRNHQWLGQEEPPNTTLIGQTIDEFELVREIARGGMGVVYEARQQSLRRTVAIKLIGDGVLANEELRMRFRMEAEAVASLSHTNIVPIHSIGCWRGIDYFVMPLIDGESLQTQVEQRHACLQQNSLSKSELKTCVQETVELVRDLARGVAYAHSRGIIHRDLKPENVLMDDGVPKIVDFGLAKLHRDAPELTRNGQVLGTPHFMSPEQARGSGDLTDAVDVYALGGILFALLTGTPPHAGNSTAEVLSQVLSDDPPSLRLIWPGGMPRLPELVELDHVIQRAMAKNASERYRSADDMADDLSRILAGESPIAAPDGIVHRMSRELSRDQHLHAFKDWGRALRRIGYVVLAAHVAMFVIMQYIYVDSPSDIAALSKPAFWGYFVPRICMLGGIAWVIGNARDGLWMPQISAERPVWSVWLGYLVALTSINLLWMSGNLDHPTVMVLACVMSGFAFIAVAGHMWGGSALLGLGFIGMAFASVAIPTVAPLFLGGWWMVTMLVFSRRYRRLG
ncbi:serine/threonine-protein kinase [Rhodopirellula halodulae]|uniref:serine/threonine-protein kinase n=1 Tax=Rhodopirellula halodulae TaxID=2894198 RepID=UPI001E3901B0|nr:serine/threonine-protein kinase [Rhodopirellula sp. JC737]MCC9658921.1 bifunctional serine/threonine protein kinase/MFS transporter [Rhodopirellula sp. JC737]